MYMKERVKGRRKVKCLKIRSRIGSRRIRARGDACHASRLRDKRGRVSKRRLDRLESRVIRGETFDDDSLSQLAVFPPRLR